MSDQRVPRRWRVVLTTPIGDVHAEHEMREHPKSQIADYEIAYCAAWEVARWIAQSMGDGVSEQARYNLVHELVDNPDNYTVKELTLRMEWIE